MRDQLEAAQSEPSIICVTRDAFDPLRDMGYVVALGPELVLMLSISNEIRFNGFSVLRIEDLTDLECPHEYEDFVQEALRLRGEEVSEAPEVDLSNLRSAILSAGLLFPVVVIHQEVTDPDVCQIGRVSGATETTLKLLGIDPDAVWDEEDSDINLADVTRVDFGGGYEDALLLVGGPAPAKPHLKSVS